MNLLSHYININVNHLLVGNVEELSASVRANIKENVVDITRIASVELLVNIKDVVELEEAQNHLRELLSRIFNTKVPAFSVLPDTMAAVDTGILKLAVCKNKDYKLNYLEYQKHPYTVCQSSTDKVVISGGICFDIQSDLLRSTQMGFDFIEQLLDREEMHFGHIVNQSIQIGANCIGDSQVCHDAGVLINQVLQLYCDPALFKQGYAPLNIASSNISGMSFRFVAAAKEAMPIHQVVEYMSENSYKTSISYVNNWGSAVFNTNIAADIGTDALVENIITQCNEVVNQVKERFECLLSESNGDYQIEQLNVYLRNRSDADDVRLIIEQQMPAVHPVYIVSALRNPKALIELNGCASIKG